MPDTTQKYKVGDRVWWWDGHQFVRCTVTRLDDQWVKKHPDGILFYEIDEPTGHSLDEDELFGTLEEAVGDPKNWEETDDGGPLMTPEAVRQRKARFILSTHLEAPDHGKTEKVSDEAVQKFLAEFGYPPRKRGDDWLTFEDAIERIKKG